MEAGKTCMHLWRRPSQSDLLCLSQSRPSRTQKLEQERAENLSKSPSQQLGTIKNFYSSLLEYMDSENLKFNHCCVSWSRATTYRNKLTSLVSYPGHPGPSFQVDVCMVIFDPDPTSISCMLISLYASSVMSFPKVWLLPAIAWFPWSLQFFLTHWHYIFKLLLYPAAGLGWSTNSGFAITPKISKM